MTNDNKKICFLEIPVPGSQLGGRRLISLSPEISYILEKRGSEYSIPEDFYDEKDIFKGEDGYFSEQLDWFRKFDSVFREKIPACAHAKVGFAAAHYYRIKCFVDSVIVYSRIFDRVIEMIGADDVLYVCRDNEGTMPSMYGPFGDQKAVLRLIAARICGKRGVRFSVMSVPPEETPVRVDAVIKEQAKGLLKKLHVKSFYRFLKYEKFRNLAGKGKDGSLSVLSLHAGCVPLDKLMSEAMALGARVYLKEDRRVNLISSPVEKVSLDLDDFKMGYDAIKTEKDLESVFDTFMRDSSLAGWVSAKCGVDVSPVIRPYFQDLIVGVCLGNLREVPLFRDLIESESIDLVLSRSSSEIGAVSALMAAAEGKKRVCFQHSCGAYESERGQVTEFGLFDNYFAMHDEAEEQAHSIVKSGCAGSCAVYQAPYQMKAVSVKWAGVKRDEKTVMYIPTKLFLGFRSFNGYIYPITWYYRFQRSLIDLFAGKKDMKFIFKFAPGQEWSAASIVSYIREKGMPNITVESGPMSECLGKAGRVLLDYPSTSLYEAAASGAPVMSLYHELLKIRPESAKLFGKSLRKFGNIDEAVRAAEEFLAADPAGYRVELPMKDTDVVGTLRTIKGKG